MNLTFTLSTLSIILYTLFYSFTIVLTQLVLITGDIFLYSEIHEIGLFLLDEDGTGVELQFVNTPAGVCFSYLMHPHGLVSP